MKKVLYFIVLAFIAPFFLFSLGSYKNAIKQTVVVAKPVEPIKQEVTLTHAQRVWIHALEWCESRGKESAINPKDSDGTPSYYSFQFKPGTFKGYALKYNLLAPDKLDTTAKVMEEMKNYDTEYEIIKYMIHDPNVRWNHEFPVCVTQKVGYPPKW